MAVTLAVTSHGPRVLWYLTRGTGVVAMVVLTVVVAAGIVTTTGWSASWWPRFYSRTLHRDLSLFALVLIAAHVVTTVADGYVPIGYVDAVVPFHSPYRTVWLGLGTLATDLLLVVLVTSALRHRIGYPAWRTIHWMAYLMWPLALFHSIGIGTDIKLGAVQLLGLACIALVGAAVVYRLLAGGDPEVVAGERARTGTGTRTHNGAPGRTPGRTGEVGLRPAVPAAPARRSRP